MTVSLIVVTVPSPLVCRAISCVFELGLTSATKEWLKNNGIPLVSPFSSIYSNSEVFGFQEIEVTVSHSSTTSHTL